MNKYERNGNGELWSDDNKPIYQHSFLMSLISFLVDDVGLLMGGLFYPVVIIIILFVCMTIFVVRMSQ